MAQCVVEFGAYGAIGDFECDDMSEEEICATAQEIIEEFAASEAGWVIVNDLEEYYG